MAEHEDPPPPPPESPASDGKAGAADDTARARPPQHRGDPERGLELRVGIFVLVAVAVLVGVILLLGAKHGVFEQRVILHAAFTNVEGLVEGAPVRLSGVEVGAVASVEFAKLRGRPIVQVNLEVSKKALRLLGEDSVARISSKGLLGDKLLDISIASLDSPRLRPDAWLRTVAPVNVNRVVEQASDALAKVEKTADAASAAMQALASPETVAALRDSFQSLERLLRQTRTGPGLAHDFFYSPQQALAFERLFASAAHLVAQLDQVAGRANALLGGVDEQGAQMVNNVSRAAAAVGRVATQVEGSQVVPNLERSARDLARIAEYIVAGRGTLGAIIADPTVYEQLVDVLGGIQRSRLLRALVRYSLSQEDQQRAARPVDEAQQGKVRGLDLSPSQQRKPDAPPMKKGTSR